MTEFLVRKFVKNYGQVQDPDVRAAYGMLTGIVGICCNLILFMAKVAVGVTVHSISVMADAFNNLSDAVSSVVGFAGVKMAQKPADEGHPFGHGRIEYIAAFIVAFIVIQVGFSLFKTSVGKILHPEELSFSLASLGVLAGSVAVKLWLALFNRKLGKRIHSSVMAATAADSLGDVAATSATVLSIVVFGVWGANVDGLVGLAVSALVMAAGVSIAKDTLEPLIGAPIDPEVYRQVSDFVNRYEGVVGSHDLIVHNYGPNRSMASIHAEVPNDMGMEAAHKIVDQIERDAAKALGIFLVIHVDPVEVENRRLLQLRQMAQEIIKKLDGRLTLHDFRVVEDRAETKLFFDLVVPREYTETMQDALKQQVCQKLKEQGGQFCCEITTECTYCVEN